MGLAIAYDFPGRKEVQAPPPIPPPWLCPLAAKGKGDRVSWAQPQGDQVGDMSSFFLKGGDGFWAGPGWGKTSEITVVQRHWDQGREVTVRRDALFTGCCSSDELGENLGLGIFPHWSW